MAMTISLFKGMETREGDPAGLPALLQDHDHILWVDILGPDPDDMRIMQEVFHFHPLAIEDTHNQHQRPKLDEYTDFLFVITNSVRAMIGETAEDDDDEGPFRHLDFNEINVFIGRNYVVTVHEAPEACLEEVRRRLIYARTQTPVTVGYLTYTMMDVVVDGYFPVIDLFEEEIERLEDVILQRPKQENLGRLFQLKHMLIELWRVVWPMRDVISRLAQPHIMSYSGDANGTTQYYFRDVGDHVLWIADLINTYRDTLTTVIDLYMSAVSNQLNRQVNRLTVLTLIIGSLTVISGFYGMNFLATWPPFEWPLGVPLVLLIMAVAMVFVVYLARRISNDA